MRDKILQLVEEGRTTKEIAFLVGLSESGVRYHREGKKKQSQHSRKVKQKALDYSGGSCLRCGYDRCKDALTFHHYEGKDFKISGGSRGWTKVQKEVDRTVLVCHNCHHELHAGLWQLAEEQIAHQKQIRQKYVDLPLTHYKDD